MKILISLALVFFLTLTLPAQSIGTEELQKEVIEFYNDSSSNYFHKKVIDRYQTGIELLAEKDFRVLYYMNGYKAVSKRLYPSTFLDPRTFKMFKLANSGKNKKVEAIAQELLSINPFDLSSLIYLSMSMDRLGKGTDNQYFQLMQGMIKAILSTGDGRTLETAIKVSEINHDEQIIGFTGFRGKKESANVWSNRNGDKLYFDYVLVFD